MDSFLELCTPAKIYVVLTAFTLIILIFSKQYGPAIAKFIFAVIFTFLLNWLCVNGMPGISWLIVLLPFIAIGLSIFGFLVYATKQKQPQKQQQMQEQQQKM